MGNLILVALLLAYLPTELLSIQVIIPETERRTMLFSSIILRCDYTTSANPQDVLVTWRFKSFCKDPVLEYYSAGYQASLQLGQDPANDCPDRQRTIRTVVQKRGINEPILGSEYRNRRITIQNLADLVINEVMWWDNGMYFCSISAPGDTAGNSEREIRLIVFHWLTVLLILIGFLLLFILLGVCCCQCCPQKCCCYVRCPCCPQTCCCPEKTVMQYRMVREAQKAMVPWMNGQPIYAPISSNASSQGLPIMYSGSYADYPTKPDFAFAPMPLAPMALQQQQAPPPHHPHANGSLRSDAPRSNQVLDFLENQVRVLDVGALPAPSVPPHQNHIRPRQNPAAVDYPPAPPSMLSALDEMGVRGSERRVITLPPIVQRVPSLTSRRGPAARGGARISSQSSGSTNRSHHRDRRGYRDASPPRRGILRDYSDDSDWDNRRGRTPHRQNERADQLSRRGGTSRPRTQSRDDLLEEPQSRTSRRERSYSPPQPRRSSWSSDEDSGRRKGGKVKYWPEKPPSYSAVELQPGRLSDRGSHSSCSVVI